VKDVMTEPSIRLSGPLPGEWTPAAIARGYRAVQRLQAAMDEGRRQRLERLGFPPDESAELSAMHTRNLRVTAIARRRSCGLGPATVVGRAGEPHLPTPSPGPSQTRTWSCGATAAPVPDRQR
jgi:hypothetical protein